MSSWFLFSNHDLLTKNKAFVVSKTEIRHFYTGCSTVAGEEFPTLMLVECYKIC